MLTNGETIYDLRTDPPARASPDTFAPSPVPDVLPEFHLPPTAPPMRPLGRRAWAVRLSLLFAMCCATAVLGHYGVVLRQSLYDAFPMMRHHGDINNAFNKGTEVNQNARALAAADGLEGPAAWTPPPRYVYTAWIKRYDDEYAAAKARADAGGGEMRFGIDYVPLRLLVATMWARAAQRDDPTALRWADGFAFTAPMLRLNTALEALSALGAFLLVRHWVLRGTHPPGPGLLARARARLSRLRAHAGSSGPGSPLLDASERAPAHPPTIKAWAVAWLAATLVWFNPNALLEGHIWPQWDGWIVPFFLLGAWLASANWWFCCGLMLGVGAMLKGQMLFVAPLFLLWPIFDARPGAAARVAVGFATALLATASPWLVQTREAAAVVGLTVGAAAVVGPFYFLNRTTWAFGVVSTLAGASILCGFLWARNWPAAGAGVALAAVVLAGPWALPRRAVGVWAAAVACAAVLLAAEHFGGSWAWWHIGFGYGTRNYQKMYMGPSVNNLAAILHDIYGWELYGRVTSIGLPAWAVARVDPQYLEGVASGDESAARLTVSIKLLLASLYVVALPLCAWAAARHARRNDPRFLIAIAAPWVILFAVLGQMHERYLYWGGVITAVGLGVSFGASLLHVLVACASALMILHCQLPGYPGPYEAYAEPWATRLETTRDLLARAHPGAGWMVLLLAAVYLYLALTPSRRNRPVLP